MYCQCGNLLPVQRGFKPFKFCANCRQAHKREANRRYSKANSKKIVARVRAWKSANPDKVKKNVRRYLAKLSCDPLRRRRMRESQNRSARARRRKNKEQIRKWKSVDYAKHKAQYIARAKRWRMTNRGRFRQLAIVQQQRRRAVKAAAKGTHNLDQWLARVGFFGWHCVYCGTKLTMRTLTQDHVIPLSRGGTNWPSNLVPACHSCNASKGPRTAKEFNDSLSQGARHFIVPSALR